MAAAGRRLENCARVAGDRRPDRHLPIPGLRRRQTTNARFCLHIAEPVELSRQRQIRPPRSDRAAGSRKITEQTNQQNRRLTMANTDFSFDFNKDGEQKTFDVIPDNTICTVQLTVLPGGAGPDGWLTRAKNGNSEHLNCEFTVIDGPYGKRKFWNR